MIRESVTSTTIDGIILFAWHDDSVSRVSHWRNVVTYMVPIVDLFGRIFLFLTNDRKFLWPACILCGPNVHKDCWMNCCLRKLFGLRSPIQQELLRSCYCSVVINFILSWRSLINTHYLKVNDSSTCSHLARSLRSIHCSMDTEILPSHAKYFSCLIFLNQWNWIPVTNRFNGWHRILAACR